MPLGHDTATTGPKALVLQGFLRRHWTPSPVHERIGKRGWALWTEPGARRVSFSYTMGDSRMADRAAVTSKVCSFCREEESQVGRLTRVQAALICDGCIDLCTGIVAEADEGDWRRWRIETIHDECSFCGRSKDQVRGLARGNAALICDQCLGMCRNITEALSPQGAKYEVSELADDESREVCSFCGKSLDDVRKLIGGRNGCYICDECVSRCTERLAQPGAGGGC